MTGCHVLRKELYRSHAIILATILIVCGVPVWATSQTSGSVVTSGARPNDVITLTNIPPARGQEFLSRLKLATVSHLPGTKGLLITGEPSEVRKAVTILNLIDTRVDFDVRDLGPASARLIPAGTQIANLVKGVCIGTFANPPRDTSKLRAIVDVHNGMVLAIGPVFRLDEIQHAVDIRSKALLLRETPPAPVSTTDGEGTGGRLTAGTVPSELSDLATQPQTSPLNLQATNNKLSPKLALSPEVQEQLRQMRARADAKQMQRQSLSQSAGTPAPAAAEAPSEKPPTAAVPQAPSPAANPEPQATKSAPEAAPQPAPGPVPSSPASAERKDTSTQAPAPSNEPRVAPPQPPTTPVAASAAAPETQTLGSLYNPENMPNGEELLDLTLQEKMPIIQLLDLVGKYLGLSYVYSPADVQGDVSLKLNGDLRGKIRVNQLYPLLEQSLRQANLVTTRHKGNVVTIVPVARVMEIDPPLVEPSLARIQSGDTVITSRFELKYIDTTSAKNLLDAMKIGLEPVTAIPEKHMLIVTTYAYRMARAEQLLQMIDQPGEPKKFRFRQLRYTMAKTLADKVKSMAEQMLESVSVTVAEPDPAASLARTPGESDIAYRTRVAQIRNAQQALRAQQQIARAQLGQETKPGVYLDADERTNRVLMIGAEKQLAIVEELVSALDVEQQDLRALQLYRMKHVDAEDVARKLQELGIISKLPDSINTSRYGYGYGSSPSRITTPLPGQPRPPTAPGTAEPQLAPTTEVTKEGLVEEPQVVVVEATNSLLVNATAEQHAKIANIVEFVDSETLTDEIPYKIYPLENSSPKHLAEVLQSLIQETVEQQKEGGKIEKVVVNRDEKIKIVPDPNTYSLIVYANKKNQEWISTLIMQLDKRRPQVLIDVTLVAITKHDKFDMELNLLRASPDLTSTAKVPNLAPIDAVGKAIGTAGGSLTAFYGDKQVQALLDTVQEKTYGRVLAKPKLLVNDNEQGKLDAKDITYVETTSALPVASGVPGTTGGLVQTSTTFQSYDAGIMLDITPHISEGDLLRLDIKLTRSDFLATVPTKPPDKKSSEVDTAVTLPNGTTAILGGLVRLNEKKGGSKVPLLSDIPLIGGLFRSIHNSGEGEFLYMFVKAEIIRPDETAGHGMKALETLSERNRQAFEKRELEYQTYQDWPGIKPKRVDPSKVLDAQ